MKQTNFTDLPQLSFFRYENFFNIYENNDNTKFYNLIASINVLPADDSSVEDEYDVKLNDTWILISYKYYGTMFLWWLVCMYNKIQNPVKTPEPGTKIKLLKKEYIAVILENLNKQINN
jgi:nucleoid-associated protein YgaU